MSAAPGFLSNEIESGQNLIPSAQDRPSHLHSLSLITKVACATVGDESAINVDRENYGCFRPGAPTNGESTRASETVTQKGPIGKAVFFESQAISRPRNRASDSPE